ncbi:MAG: tandem-95 repeat protein, partial [Spongiibacteraceae bacterium]
MQYMDKSDVTLDVATTSILIDADDSVYSDAAQELSEALLKRLEQDRDIHNMSLDSQAVVELASLEITNLLVVDTNEQAAVAPPADGDGGNEAGSAGFEMPAWAWTIIGALVIGGLKVANDDDDNSSAGNSAPNFLSDALSPTGTEDNPVTITAFATDVNADDTLVYSVTDPANGTLSEGAADGVYIYTPNAEFSGVDNFVVTVVDGMGGSDELPVEVTISAVNDAPVADAEQDIVIVTNNTATISVTASDAENDSLSYSSGSASNGVVSVGSVAGEFVYTPNVDFTGDDSFEITVSDGNGGVVTQTVSVTVTPADIYVLSADNAPTLVEGDSGVQQLVYEFSLDRPVVGEDLIVQLLTSGSATADEDFVSPATTLSFVVGESTATLAVDVNGDVAVEGNETLRLRLSGDNILDTVITQGTITDDDDAPTIALLEVDDSGVLADDNITQVITPSFVINAKAGAVVEVFLDGSSVGTATEQQDNPGVYDFTSDSLVDGSYEFSVQATVAGGVMNSTAEILTVDGTAPSLGDVSVDAETDTLILSLNEELATLDDSLFSFILNGEAAAATLSSNTANTLLTFSFATDVQAGDSVDLAIAAGA